ncbi:MAG: hypothetical protein COB02_07815 [Candidatus Cloacimonadota bacterium]|nr:MAG: hypothetical protein COB02_07815 [Candidatus Cloacimonadota bacterium]
MMKMVNSKKILGLSIYLLLVIQNFSFDLFGSGDSINKKMTNSINSSVNDYVNKSLNNSLSLFNMSDILSGDMTGFESSLNSGVSNIVKDSLDFSIKIQKDILDGVGQQMGDLQKNLTPFIEKTIQESLQGVQLNSKTSELFNTKDFQKSLGNYLSKTIGENLEKGLKPLSGDLFGKKITGDFFRSLDFVSSFGSFSKQKANKSDNFDENEQELEAMGDNLDKSLSAWGNGFEKSMDKWGNNFEKKMESFGDSLEKSLTEQLGGMFGDDD